MVSKGEGCGEIADDIVTPACSCHKKKSSILSHHLLSLLLGLVLQLEALRQLEVKLNCGTLRQGSKGVCGMRQMQQPDATSGTDAMLKWTPCKTHLVAATEGVVDLNVNLRAVEGAISRVEFPLVAKGIERRLERLLSPAKVGRRARIKRGKERC